MTDKRFFAASNTERGFSSYFKEIFRDRADRCYIIKGGPGTGKSRLMSEMGEAAENAGYNVEYYFCSSDPDSLDGIFADREGECFAVIDGTAPHAEDVASPGYKDNIIDLGRFWNARVLRDNRQEILLHGEKKKAAYCAAYRALSAYGSMTRIADEIVLEFADVRAISEECAKIALDLLPLPSLRMPQSAIGMKGMRSFDSFARGSRHTLYVSDIRGYGCSYLYFDALVRSVGSCITSPDPILCGRYNAMQTDGVAVVASSLPSGEPNVDIGEFVDRSAFLMQKDRIERLRSLAQCVIGEAEISFREAGEAHMKLEEIFSSAMNFNEKEAYSANLCAKIASGDL